MRQLLPPAGEVDLLSLYEHPRSTLRMNFVTSADGAATLDGHSAGLSGRGDRRIFRVLRALADVVLVGAGTVRAEGYGSVLPPPDLQKWRQDRGRSPGPALAVVSGSLALDPASEVFAAEPLILTGSHPPAERVAALGPGVDVVRADSPAGWLALLVERGLSRVLCEGGPALFGSLLQADLVDELCLTVAPLLVAEGGPGLTRGASDGPRRLALRHVLEEDGSLFLRYARSAPVIQPAINPPAAGADPARSRLGGTNLPLG